MSEKYSFETEAERKSTVKDLRRPFLLAGIFGIGSVLSGFSFVTDIYTSAETVTTNIGPFRELLQNITPYTKPAFSITSGLTSVLSYIYGVRNLREFVDGIADKPPTP